MIIRQFKPDQYEQLCKTLAENAYPEPQSASYTVSLNVGTEEYRLRLCLLYTSPSPRDTR